MVAFHSSRRGNSPGGTVAKQPLPHTLWDLNDQRSDPAEAISGSRRAASGVQVVRGENGQICEVRIGRWRTLSATPERRVAEVREISPRRVAVRIERDARNQGPPSSEIWQLYDLDGRLEAAMQTTPDGKFALMTNYRTRQARRMTVDANGELMTVESWYI